MMNGLSPQPHALTRGRTSGVMNPDSTRPRFDSKHVYYSESGPARLIRTFGIFVCTTSTELEICTLIYVQTLCSVFVEAVEPLA